MKVYRCWAGGGTVKLVILNSQYAIPDSELVEEVQTEIDPSPQGKGYGIAPIGHVVTVAAATDVKINVSADITLKEGYDLADVQTAVETAISSYLEARRQEWCKQSDTEQVIVRAAYILPAMLNVQNVVDVANITINGETDRISLETDEVPTLGAVTLTEE